MIMILGKGMVNFSIPTETEMYPSENVQPLKFCSIQRKAGGENMPEEEIVHRFEDKWAVCWGLMGRLGC